MFLVSTDENVTNGHTWTLQQTPHLDFLSA